MTKLGRRPYPASDMERAAAASIVRALTRRPARVPRCRYCRTLLPTARAAHQHDQTDCRTPQEATAEARRADWLGRHS